jgi:hypothetical protein
LAGYVAIWDITPKCQLASPTPDFCRPSEASLIPVTHDDVEPNQTTIQHFTIREAAIAAPGLSWEIFMKRAFAGLLFLLILCFPSFGQERGGIQCDAGSTAPVPAWTAPGSAYVVEQLSCGQMVSIAGLERGYVRIQIGERFGFVNSKDSGEPECFIEGNRPRFW